MSVIRYTTTAKPGSGKFTTRPSVSKPTKKTGFDIVQVLESKPKTKVKTKFKEIKAHTRIIFIRTSLQDKDMPIGCMAYRTFPFEGGLTIQYGISTHDPKDEFNRTIGRKVAEGRLNNVIEAGKTFSGVLVPFVNDGSVQHNKNCITDRKGSKVIISGTFTTTEPNMSRALSDLFQLLESEDLPNRIKKHMHTMSRRVWQPTGNFNLNNTMRFND